MTFGQFRLLASTLSFALFGTFYLPGLGPSPLFPWQEAPQSVLASKCERLWLDEARNDLALECYLASQTDRLCREGEKAHLVYFISRYEQSRRQYDAKLWGYLIGVQFGMAKPGKTDSAGRREDTLAKLNRVQGEQALKLKNDDNFIKAVNMRTLIDTDLTRMVSRLAAKGYVEANDFGWRAPDWVTEAFTDDLKVTPACKQPAA